MFYFSKSTTSQKTYYSPVQLHVFATVKQLETIIYSEKTNTTEEIVILAFQEYEWVCPNFEVHTLPKITSVLIQVLWGFSHI